MENSSDFLEKMMELGIGMSVLQQMPKMMAGVMPNDAPGSVNNPPVLCPAEVYIVVDHSQAGPFSQDDLLKLVKNRLLLPETLVWKHGMANWQPASQVPEVNKLFILAKIG